MSSPPKKQNQGEANPLITVNY